MQFVRGVAQAPDDFGIAVDDATVRVENENEIGDRVEERLQIGLARAPGLFRAHARDDAADLRGNRFERAPRVRRDLVMRVRGEVERGDDRVFVRHRDRCERAQSFARARIIRRQIQMIVVNIDRLSA